MTPSAAKRCGTCKWFMNTYGSCGSCEFPLPEWARDLLLRLHRLTLPTESISPVVMYEDSGVECKTWHAK